MALTMTERDGWKPGLPPGKYYEGMVDDFEVYFSPGGAKSGIGAVLLMK